MIKDGNGQGMGRVEYYHTYTRIVNGYETLPIPIPDGYPYPTSTHTHWVPTGRSNITQVTQYFTFIDSILGAKTWVFTQLL
jgi:hypothetical protein